MDLTLNDEQAMIRDAAADVLAARSASADVRRALDQTAGRDDALWGALSRELGWNALALPEAMGGMGLGAREQALLMEQLGRRLACVPYLSTACVVPAALTQCAAPAAGTWLARIAAGEISAALAMPLDMPFNPQPLTVTAHEAANGFRLSGVAQHVIDGARAELLLIPAHLAHEGGHAALFALERASAEGLCVTPLDTLDGTRPIARLEFDDVRVGRNAWLAGRETTRVLERAAWLGALMLAAEQLGGAQQCLDLTLDYTGQRVQFGRAIASFQAVKHRCAQMMVQVEAARSAVLGAAHAWDAAAGTLVPPVALLAEVAAAKAAANDAYAFCAQEAIQLHGGVGFTWEYDPQLYFKRAQASGAQFGSTPQLLEWLACHAIDGVEPAVGTDMDALDARDARASAARRGVLH